MNSLFIPLREGKPVCLFVNGRQVILVSSQPDAFLGSSMEDAFDEVCELDNVEDELELAHAVDQLFGRNHSDVVLAPADIAIDEMLEKLRLELPWIH